LLSELNYSGFVENRPIGSDFVSLWYLTVTGAEAIGEDATRIGLA
jgi:hypothetical protein